MALKPCILNLEMVEWHNDRKESQKTDIQRMRYCAYLPSNVWQFSMRGHAMFWFGGTRFNRD